MKKLSKIKLLIGLCVFFANIVQSQDFRTTIDNSIKKALNEITSIPGLSIVVTLNDSIYFVNSYGYADIEQKKFVTNNTLFYIASTTKSFVGSLAQIMESEGVLDLDTPITKYKPIIDFENKEKFSNITIRNLLSHTSGISNGYLTWRNAFTGQYTDELMIMLLEDYTSHKDNNAFKYDNIGYNIFDIILKQEFGKDWRQLLDEKIFKPMKMLRTTAYMSKAKSKNWIKAMPYTGLGENLTPISIKIDKDDKVMHAAGGLISSANDLGKWLLFNVNQGVIDDKKIYETDIVSKIHITSVKFNKKGPLFIEKGYGLGWYTALYDDKKVYYHNGGYPGYAARISFMPEKKVGIAVLVNENFFGDNIADLLTSIVYDYFIGKEFSQDSLVNNIKAIKDKAVSMSIRYGEIVSQRSNKIQRLNLPIKEYLGIYVNEGFGTFNVTNNNNMLLFSMGLVSSIGTPLDKEDNFSIELSGIGSASNLEFIIENNKVHKLIWKGLNFIKNSH